MAMERARRNVCVKAGRALRKTVARQRDGAFVLQKCSRPHRASRRILPSGRRLLLRTT
jgi:hypothetical protein